MNREETIRDHQERLNRVMQYIQRHLSESLKLNDLAGVANLSPFHFHRIFQAYAGETLNCFVRRVRLEWAASQLCHTRRSVTDIALDTGYETHGAFTTSFTKHFGCSPSDFRKEKTVYLLQQQQLVIKPGKEYRKMDIEIRDIEEKKVIYVQRIGKYSDSAGEAWQAVCAYAGPNGLIGPQSEFIGISYDDPTVTPEEKLRYDACITVDREVSAEGEVGVQSIPAGKYAVGLHKGPYDGLLEAYQYLYGEWLPESGRELRDAPCFEKYLNSPEDTAPEDLLTEIYAPIE
jgi:AraC family transcriptional regulator